MISLLLALGCTASNPSETHEHDTGPIDTGEVKTPYQRDLEPLLRGCVGCHQGDAPEAELDLTDLRAATIDVPALQVEMMLITPGDHLQSYLWHKVNGSQSLADGLGTQMPVGAPWSAEDIELLAVWIDLGTPE